MKKILFAAMLLMGGITTSCTDYQDEIDALDYRVTVLENLVSRLNTDMKSMQVIVQAMEEGDYITNVRQTENGYIVNFHKAGPVEILDGVDGQDGKDAQAPDISIAQDPTDNQWYWKLNGEWLTANGQRIRANGHDGTDGKDATSPKVRINPETGIWDISVDGGITWISTGTSATGRDGKDGENGKDGKNGNQFFRSVTYEVNSDGEFMVIVTNSGQTFRIPIYTN